MVDALREREDKYDVAADYAVPELDGVAPGASVERSTVQLRSTYFDTDDRALQGFRVTLRRREGDADVGWQLKVPGRTERTELRAPLTDGDVPARLAELVRGLTGGAPLLPVAQLQTERARHRVVVGGRTLVEVADDRVRASVDGVPIAEWREVEAELIDGRKRDLRAVGRAVVAAGARPSASRSKLARALVEAGDSRDDPIAEYVRAQLVVLGRGDIDLRRGLEPIHKTRVAVRRMRSVLRVFGPLFAGDVSVLEAELGWYQQLLGDVRDREVLRARLAAALAQLPPDFVLGPVAGELDGALLAEQARAKAELVAALDGERYAALLRALRAGPSMRGSVRPAQLRGLARKAERTARKRLRQGVASGADDRLHRARKALKRSRYALEVIEPLVGKPARRAIVWHKHAQDVLGEHQDSVVAAEMLRTLGARRGADAEHNGFTYGVLWQREQERADAARRAIAKLR